MQTTPKRCSLEELRLRQGASPCPAAPGGLLGYTPKLLVGCGCAAQGSCEFKVAGNSALVRGTNKTGAAKTRDPGRCPLVHTRIHAGSHHQQPPASSALLHHPPMADHQAEAARSRKEPRFAPRSPRAPTVEALWKKSHPYISWGEGVAGQGPHLFRFSPTSTGYLALAQPPSTAVGGASVHPSPAQGTRGSPTL